MPSRLPVPVRPSRRPSLDERLERLELEWASPPVASNTRPKKPSAFSPRTWNPLASERALAAEMVGGVVGSELSAPPGESLLALKKKAPRTYSAFGSVTELVALAAVDARSGASPLHVRLRRGLYRRRRPCYSVDLFQRS